MQKPVIKNTLLKLGKQAGRRQFFPPGFRSCKNACGGIFLKIKVADFDRQLVTLNGKKSESYDQCKGSFIGDNNNDGIFSKLATHCLFRA